MILRDMLQPRDSLNPIAETHFTPSKHSEIHVEFLPVTGLATHYERAKIKASAESIA